jgi:hypothetical protein
MVTLSEAPELLRPYINRLMALGLRADDQFSLSPQFMRYDSQCEQKTRDCFSWNFRLTGISHGGIDLTWSEIESIVRDFVAAREVDLIALGM